MMVIVTGCGISITPEKLEELNHGAYVNGWEDSIIASDVMSADESYCIRFNEANTIINCTKVLEHLREWVK